jgi:hypothetical protein
LVQGDFILTGGTKSAAVPHPDGSHRLLYCMESPECWFEDFGAARLRRGRARVKLNGDFAAAVRTGSYMVFLTVEGDSCGLYVSRKDKTGFEVRESQDGASSVKFSYRVVAKRKDVDAQRMPKVKLPRLEKYRALAKAAQQNRSTPKKKRASMSPGKRSERGVRPGRRGDAIQWQTE